MDLYLGIDQSLRSPAFALVNEDGAYVKSLTVSVASSLRGALRLRTIVNGFREFVYPGFVKNAAIEGFSVHSTNRPFDLGTVFGVLLLETHTLTGLEAVAVPPTSLKLFFTGRGTADKEDMLYTVKSRLGVDLGDRDDEADAVALALWARAATTGQFTRRHEAEAMKPKRVKPRIRVTTKDNV